MRSPEDDGVERSTIRSALSLFPASCCYMCEIPQHAQQSSPGNKEGEELPALFVLKAIITIAGGGNCIFPAAQHDGLKGETLSQQWKHFTAKPHLNSCQPICKNRTFSVQKQHGLPTGRYRDSQSSRAITITFMYIALLT